MTSLVVDDLHFAVRRSSRRRTVQITVDRGGELILSAPDECPIAKLEGFVRAKRIWIYSKLAEKEALWQAVPAKEYVSGEGFPYLGRGYRLLLVDVQDVPVKLDRGRFRLRRADAAEGRTHMIRWYTERGRAWLRRRVARLAGRVGVKPAGVTVSTGGPACCRRGLWSTSSSTSWCICTSPTTPPSSGCGSSGRCRTLPRGSSGSLRTPMM